jgi:hypothetical protein
LKGVDMKLIEQPKIKISKIKLPIISEQIEDYQTINTDQSGSINEEKINNEIVQPEAVA